MQSASRKELLILGLAIACIHISAFLFTAQVLSRHGASMSAMVQKMDQADYLQLADTMLSTGRFAFSPESAPEVFRTPGYPSFLAFTYLISGHSSLAPFVANGIVLGLTSALTVLIAAALGVSRRGALLAGTLIGLSPDAFLLSMTATGGDVLYTFVFGAAALLALQRPLTLRHALVTGILLGVATLIRPIGVLASLPILLGMGIIEYSGWRTYLRITAYGLIAWLFVLMPWYARNAAISGTPLLSTVSTFNIVYTNIPQNEVFWRHTDEAQAQHDALIAVGTTSTAALRGLGYIDAMKTYERGYLQSHLTEYGIFHLYRSTGFFFMSGFNVLNAILSHEAPSLRLPLFPTEGENLTRYLMAQEWDSAFHALGQYWFTTLERTMWLVVTLASLLAWALVRGRNRMVLLLFSVIIATNIVLISPSTQARYRFPVEPYIWVAAVYTGVALWQKYRERTA